MEPKYRPLLTTIKFRATVKLLILMGLFIRAIFHTAKKMAKGFTNLNSKSIKASGNQIVNMVLANTKFCLQDRFLTEPSRTIKFKVKGL